MDVVDIAITLLMLIVLEIVLGVDNLVFLSLLTEKLPAHQRKRARKWGLTFAWVTRLCLLFSAVWLSKLTKPLVTWHELSVSARDIFLFIGGMFLITKATQEIHHEVSHDTVLVVNTKSVTFRMVVLQVALMDIIFSLDRVLTAIGLTNQFWIMATAISCAILVMIYASEPVSVFISKYPTVRMLALCFLILIGTFLVADAFAFHIPRGYLYFAMLFSLGVEMLNLFRHSRKKKK